MDKSVYLRMAEQDAEHWWFVARRRILQDQIAALRLPPDARVLEAGCGPGGNLAMLSEFGQLDAFEMDEDARRIASARGGIEVRPGKLPGDIGFEPGSFDLIAALDVIEHIEADLESVQALAKLLRPGARLILTVPAYPWLWSIHDDRHHHKRRYTRPAVQKLAEEAGLVVEKCSHFNTILFPLIVGIRFFKKLTGVNGKPDDDMPPPFLNAVLGRIFGAERFALRHVSLPFGVSILCIARRR
ncbi:MAG: class I SAM-dependent methyltransferase [Proteobacteria bacterium]|nr:class I SAM-dependent methyltransferase [Pseudomonadota bacterium]